jgi:hypothetical protein
MKSACFFSALCLLAVPLHAQIQSLNNASVEVSFRGSGAYTVTNKATRWELKGTLPGQVSGLRTTTGRDALGAYREIEAGWNHGARTAAIRLYQARPAVLFLDEHKGSDANAAPFPDFAALPAGLMRFSYGMDSFAPFEFGKLGAQGPWLLFDHSGDTMALSPADNFLVADLSEAPDGRVTSGIDSQSATLPSGFTHKTLLVFGSGINRTFAAWGMDLQKLDGKQPVANDADVLLDKFGYWTDHGGTYYYKFDPQLGYEGTLLAVRDQFRKLGVPIAYMQLDSWWYPKEKGNTLANGTGDNGAMVYRADPAIFPNGLDAFHQRLGLPMVTHARWISQDSPYRKEYRMSKNVIIDPRYWNSTAAYLKKGGVAVYEQDWLNDNARPAINIEQSHAFLADMADAMEKEGLSIQYCMPLPGYFLASTQFSSLHTIRTSDDRFERARYDNFLYGSALAHAVGLWPWSDVFMSNELPNLVISTLSAGPVGTGDALAAIDAANLKRVMRADSVILKPDTPLMPIDATYLADANDSSTPRTSPMVAMTSTKFGSASEDYVLSYPRSGDASGTTVSLSSLGIRGPVYAWDWVAQKGETIPAGGSLQMHYAKGWGYEVLAPINTAGIALLGDTSKIVPLARKRFTSVSNRGETEAAMVFAPGENSVTLTGYAAQAPRVHASAGKVSGLRFDAATHLFSFAVSPSPDGTAAVGIR